MSVKESIYSSSLSSPVENDEITFNRVSSADNISLKTWKVIPLPKAASDHLKSLYSQLFSSTWSLGGFMKPLINGGLFMHSVPGKYSAYADGTLSSMIKNGGQISGHYGYVDITSSVISPLVVYQLSSIATGQYYLNLISQQLKSIQERINELTELFHGEKHAILVNACKHFTEYCQRSSFTHEDFDFIKHLNADLENIREEYLMMVQRLADKLDRDLKNRALTSLKKVRTVINDFEKTNFFFKIHSALKADELYCLGKLVELHMNICYKNPDTNRINRLDEMVKQLSNLKAEDFLFHKSRSLYDEVKFKIFRKVLHIESNARFGADAIKRTRYQLERKFYLFEKERQNTTESLLRLISVAVKPFFEKKGILVEFDRSNPNVYVEA